MSLRNLAALYGRYTRISRSRTEQDVLYGTL